MITAREAKETLERNLYMRTISGKSKALAVLDIINQCIINAVNECSESTEIFIFGLTTLDNQDEKQAYTNTLKHELEQNGYTVKFSATTGVMRIIWGY